MTDPVPRQGLWSIPGEGVLARQGSLVVLSGIDEPGFLEKLLDLLASASPGGNGRAFADAVGNTVEAGQGWGSGQPGQPGPAVVAFGPAGAGLAVTVAGTAWAEITTAQGTHRLSAGQPSTVLKGLIGVPVQTVRAGLGSDHGGGRTDRFSRLDSGTVRAGGLSYYSGQPDPAAQEQPAQPPAGPPPVAPVPPPAAPA
ncbi:MAG: hypothetical protein J2P35_01715, partial [Actinobacteria bacterium]|nr:hypothetical protein [Actinomycetota bacterium]